MEILGSEDCPRVAAAEKCIETRDVQLYGYMGQKLQDGKKVLEMSVTTLHSKCRPIQTIHPTDLGLLPSWISISRPPAQEFSPSWNARKRLQERVEIS